MECNKNYNCRCDQCGKYFHKKPSHINKTHNFCSQKCHYEFKKTSMKGKGNHQYGLKGRLNASWKTDKRITNNGYLKIYKPEHPLSDRDGRILEHRYLAEKYLAKPEDLIYFNGKYILNPNLDVHHKDKNKLNNDLNNLQILTRNDHMKLHGEFKHRKFIIINKCKECGKDFITTKSRNAKYCSQECSKINRYKKVVHIEKECPICGKKFIVTEKDKDKRTCCSIECSNKLRNRGMVEFICDNCGNESKMKKSRYVKSDKHFCCKECYYEYKRNK